MDLGSETYSTISVDHDDEVAYLTLRRPAKRNAVNPAMRDELVDVGARLADDGDLRCLVVRGAGPAFSGGLDLQEGIDDLLSDWAEHLSGDALVEKGLALASAFEWIPRLEVPSIAAVHGYAYGAGCQLALACDFRIVAESARIGLVESRLGLMPDMGATFRLPRLVSDSVARRMILLGEVLDGIESAAVGLADEVVPDDQLATSVGRLAHRLAAQPPLAVRGARRAMAAARELPDDAALLAAVTEQAACLSSEDFRRLIGTRR
ncbi:MAG TPA: enoyl-CoA hydratase/isomerase family protein [Marmoricola sp.]|nr:enoyl-CoA hydratase/isomerase family protein [Marmoricola sp.]